MNSICLLPYDWTIEEGCEYLRIIAWCLDAENKTYCIRIRNYYYSLYISGSKNQSNIESALYKYKENIAIHRVQRRTLYYFQENPRSFYLIKTNLHEAYNHIIKKFGSEKNILYEEKTDIILKFLTERKLSYSKWICFLNPKVPKNRISHADAEYFVDCEDCISADMNKVIYPKILSFDIECYSEERNTMPKPFFSQNRILMISCVVFENNKKKKYILTHVPVNSIEDTEIIKVNDEEELLEKFQDFIIQQKPQILTGFNIFGFDYYYITARLGAYLKEWKNIGLLNNEKTMIKETYWESSAYGQQKMIFPKASGIISIDLMRYISREYKLPTYSLNTASKTFLGREKLDVSHNFIFETYDKFLRGSLEVNAFTKIAQYCIEDSNLVMDIFNTLNLWITFIEMSNIFHVSITDLYTRGQQIRCYNQLYKKCKEKGYIIEKKKDDIKSYQGADVIEPKQGIHDHVICLDFKSLYPSIIILKNICYTTFLEKLPPSADPNEYNIIEWEDDEKKYRYYFYKKQIGLIPEILKNLIDERRKVREELKTKKDLEYIILDKKQLALKISANAFFGFLGTKEKGMIPLTAASMCITAIGRENIRRIKEKIEKEYDANVIYGDTDSVFFNIPQVKSIAETFEIGNKITTEINKFLEKPLEVEFEKACKMLCLLKKKYSFWYYDPKSKDFKYNIFIQGIGKEKRNLIEPEIQKMIPNLSIGENKKIIKINDQDYSIIIKKEPALENKGNELSRRDKPRFLKKIYSKVLNAILVEEKNIDQIYDMIQEYIIDFITLNFDFEDLFTIKTVHTNYNKPNMYKTITDRMKSEEISIYEGLKIETIVLKTNDPKAKIGERTFIKEELLNIPEPKKRVDIEYYIELMITPIEENLFQIAMKKHIDELTIKKYERVLECILAKYPYIKKAKEIYSSERKYEPDCMEWLNKLMIFSDRRKEIEEMLKDDGKIKISTPVTNMLRIIRTKKDVLQELQEKNIKT